MNEFAEKTCITCEHLELTEDIISPTSSSQPHLLGNCSKCPFNDVTFMTRENSKNFLTKITMTKDNDIPIWINLVTGETWVDGGCSITQCPNYEKSSLIFPKENENNG